MFGQVVVDGIEVESPCITAISALDELILEEGSPFGTEDVLFEVASDGAESSFDAEFLEVVEISSEFSETFVVELVHGSAVDAEVASHLVEVVACSSKRHLSSQTVTAQSGHRDLVLVHEPRNVVLIDTTLLATSSHPNSSE